MKIHHDDPLPLLEPVQGMTESKSDSDSSNENPALVTQSVSVLSQFKVVHGLLRKKVSTVAIPGPVQGNLSMTPLTNSSIYAKRFIPRHKQFQEHFPI